MAAQLVVGSGAEMQLPLNRLLTLGQAGFEDAAWCAREIDAEHVEHLVASNMSTWPAIDVAPVNLGGEIYYAVVSGNHRWAAVREKKANTIKANINTYRDEAAVIETAFEANLQHGLPASSQTRSDFAVWLYWNDPSNKPNLSAIARRVGLNVSTVQRAVRKAEKAAQAQEEEQREGASSRADTDNAGKLVTALQRFFDNERTFLGTFGDGTGQRDVTGRAKAIARYLQRLDEQKRGRAVKQLLSLQEMLDAFIEKYVKTGQRKKA